MHCKDAWDSTLADLLLHLAGVCRSVSLHLQYFWHNIIDRSSRCLAWGVRRVRMKLQTENPIDDKDDPHMYRFVSRREEPRRLGCIDFAEQYRA